MQPYDRFTNFCLHDFGTGGTELETHQPEEQHGFWGGKRVEEHLVTTRLVLDKFSSAHVPTWIVSLDLSKAFDRVHWPALWFALSEQGLSEHMIWMIQKLYRDQQGQVVGSNGCSRSFAIHGGVRQGCVLSPWFFCSMLEMSMANWHDEMEHLGLHLCDGGRSLLDLRFADAILIFGTDSMLLGYSWANLLKILPQWDYTFEYIENKGPHNTNPTTVTIANAEWIDHIGSWHGIKSQVARMHVDDGTGTNHNIRCWMSSAGRGKGFQCKQVEPLWPESFDCSESRIFWSCHIPHSVFGSRTPNHLPQWFTQYGCCISSASPIKWWGLLAIWNRFTTS